MKEIGLTQGAVAIVDDEDYDELSRFNWCLSGAGYAVRGKGPRGSMKIIGMHHQVMGVVRGHQRVDHQNLNKLDNRRGNLRLCTQAENNRNQPKRRDNTSGFKGVVWCKRTQRWIAQIGHQGRNLWLGRFDSAVQAALAYDQAARQHFGEFAALNFPERT